MTRYGEKKEYCEDLKFLIKKIYRKLFSRLENSFFIVQYVFFKKKIQKILTFYSVIIACIIYFLNNYFYMLIFSIFNLYKINFIAYNYSIVYLKRK